MSPPQLLRAVLPAALCERWLRAIAAHAGRSLRLAAHPGLPAAEVMQAVAASALAAPIVRALGTGAPCDLDQSWVRHGWPPHSWHQDGALGFDFMACEHRELPEDALLEMLTCWIALTPCGTEAPGLEWVKAATPQLLRPDELDDKAVHRRFAASGFEQPILQPGDAILFDGALLHRTHLRPSMRGARSSLELRFFRAGAWPARLAGDRRVTGAS